MSAEAGAAVPPLGADPALGAEWQALFRAHEQYELAAQAIKLLSLLLCVLAWGSPALWLLLALLWLQEAMLKTFQARLGERLLRVESGLREGGVGAWQLHSEWLAARPSGAGLLKAYAAAAMRPTVALPYLLLLPLAFFLAR